MQRVGGYRTAGWCPVVNRWEWLAIQWEVTPAADPQAPPYPMPLRAAVIPVGVARVQLVIMT